MSPSLDNTRVKDTYLVAVLGIPVEGLLVGDRRLVADRKRSLAAGERTGLVVAGGRETR